MGIRCLADLVEAGVDLSGLDAAAEWRSVAVARRAPRCRAQFQAAQQLWPCSFREDAALERLLAGRWFDAAALERQRRWMRLSAAARTRSGEREAT